MAERAAEYADSLTETLVCRATGEDRPRLGRHGCPRYETSGVIRAGERIK